MNTADMIKIDNELSQRPVEFFGTREQWEALTSAQQAHYRKVNFRGDSGGGGGTGSPNFVGTTAEWNALSAAEKAEFDKSKGVTVNFSDDNEDMGVFRRTRKNITNNLTNLSSAIADQDLEKYGYSIGDYFIGPISNYTYMLGDYNTFKGTNTPYCITDNHLGIVVNTHTISKYHTTNVSSVGYAGSTLHSYLSGTVLDNIKSDFISLFGDWDSHLLSHTKLYTTAIDAWNWTANQYIAALSCIQVDGSSQWDANVYQEGEASKSLELFRKYKWTELFGNEYPWLRNISNQQEGNCACEINNAGHLDGLCNVTWEIYVAGLILFK